MKSLAILALALAGFTFTPAASAADCGYTYRPVTHCAPVYVCTKEVCRTTKCLYAYDHCGRQYSYHVTVVTYANYYSDGSYNTFTKSYRA